MIIARFGCSEWLYVWMDVGLKTPQNEATLCLTDTDGWAGL